MHRQLLLATQWVLMLKVHTGVAAAGAAQDGTDGRAETAVGCRLRHQRPYQPGAHCHSTCRGVTTCACSYRLLLPSTAQVRTSWTLLVVAPLPASSIRVTSACSCQLSSPCHLDAHMMTHRLLPSAGHLHCVCHAAGHHEPQLRAHPGQARLPAQLRGPSGPRLVRHGFSHTLSRSLPGMAGHCRAHTVSAKGGYPVLLVSSRNMAGNMSTCTAPARAGTCPPAVGHGDPRIRQLARLEPRGGMVMVRWQMS